MNNVKQIMETEDIKIFLMKDQKLSKLHFVH